MTGSCVIIEMCNGVMVSICPSSTVLNVFLFSAFLAVTAPAWVATRLRSLGRTWATVPQGCPTFQERVPSPVSSAVCPSPCLLKHLPTFPHVSSRSSCHSFIRELKHSLCFVFKEGVWQEAGAVWSRIPRSQCKSFLWVQRALDHPIREWRFGRGVCGVVVTSESGRKDFSKPTVAGTV